GTGEEVLTADAQPFGVAPGEVDVAVGVHVAEVAGVEPPVSRALLRRLLVLVVALEQEPAIRVDDLAHGLVRIEQTPGVVEACRGTLAAVLVENFHTGRSAEAAGGIAGGAREADTDLAGAVAVDHVAAEALGEGLDVLAWRFVSVGEAERVVGVVGPLRRVHDVGERIADIVEQGGAVAANVGKKGALAEPARQRETAAGE